MRHTTISSSAQSTRCGLTRPCRRLVVSLVVCSALVIVGLAVTHGMAEVLVLGDDEARLESSRVSKITDPLSSPYVQRITPASKRMFRYVIRSTAHRHYTYLRAALQSWAREVRVGFVATDDEQSLSYMSRRGGGLLRKVSKAPGHDLGRKALRVLANLCDAVSDVDFFVYVDDETFVATVNLEAAVADAYDPARMLYGGCAFLNRSEPLVSVAGGIVFSRKTVAAVCRHVNDEDHACSWQNDGTYHLSGDAAIAACMKAVGADAVHIHGFNQLYLRDITSPSGGSCGVSWMPSQYQCHPPVSRLATVRCEPDDMRELHYFMMQMLAVAEVTYSSHVKAVRTPHYGSILPTTPVGSVVERQQPFAPATFAYVVLTTGEHHSTRLNEVLHSWAWSARPPVFAATDRVSDDDRRLFEPRLRLELMGEPGRNQLGRKTIGSLAAMCNVTADFYVFVDDDCFVFVPNLEAEVSRLYSSTAPLYLGSSLTHLQHAFISGGGGAVLSARTVRDACRAMSSSLSQCSPVNPLVWGKPGDMALGDCMHEIGTHATHHDGFHPLRLSDMLDYSADKTSCDVWWIPAFHKCRPPTSVTLTSHYTPVERFSWYQFVSASMVVRRSQEFGDPVSGLWRQRDMPRIGAQP